MERPHRPPPLTIPPPPRPRTRVRRPRGPNARQARQFKRWLFRAQIANDVAHVVGASILLWIMSWFLYNVSFPLTYRTGPAAVALLVVLSTDILLDARSIVHAHDAWPGWALLLRLLVGTSLIAVFWVYIATYGRVLAYMFLWGIGLWDLLFVVLCRHWLGKEVKRYGGRARRVFRERRSPGISAHRLNSAVAEEQPNRVVVMDIEAARPTNEDEGSGGGRVGLPLRMGVRRAKNSMSVSVNSIASGAGTGTTTRDASPPPPVFMRPA
ncbi:uncharacterized protein ColSpa_08419 [Colletotrichum spaethianum]|uniref:Uncharacterized protein n=1 Tax=Colletotrichum spaethianum TaxID=700344 RepID=A0AA37P9P6_9PEZI|nr:uncharacterized protein ColSpa_08419 [Colletotrichum spaethianum]GKT48238.1 hypothetical protein ColSpa_08419 [Colletotrichum spaethianum]